MFVKQLYRMVSICMTNNLYSHKATMNQHEYYILFWLAVCTILRHAAITKTYIP